MASSASAWKIVSTSPKTALRCSPNSALRLISPSADRSPKPVQDVTDTYKTTLGGDSLSSRYPILFEQQWSASPRRIAAPEFSRGFQPTVGMNFLPVASATIEFSRRSRDVEMFAGRPVG